MKIYSWNVFCFNKKVDEVCAYIENLDFDVISLQEVTPEILARLKAMPFHITYHVDVLRMFSKNKTQYNYVVILSRHELHGHGTLQFPELPFPLHTRIFIRTMAVFKFTWLTERGIVYTDLQINGKTFRVYSVHLTLWGPSTRANEFALLMNSLPKNHASIICGDFNVIEYGPMKILNYLLGGTIRQSTPWYPERALFEERFAAHGFRNPLLGKVTHKFSRSQLDHILVPKEIEVKKAWVVSESYGSDHQPVAVEVVI